MPRRRLTPGKRAFILVWHLARGVLVRSGSSKTYHFAKAAYHGKKLAEQKIEENEAEKAGLTKKQYAILLVLSTGEAFTVKGLAEKLDASQGTLRKHLNKFAAMDLVEKDISTRPYLYRMEEEIRRRIEGGE